MSKVILITGASSGIGRSIAEFLLEKGMIVYGTSRNPDKVQSIAFNLVSLDVTNRDSISNAVNTVLEKEGRIDVLVNNAGMGITGPIEDTPTDEMRAVFETNFFGAVEVMKAVLPSMREQQSGLIINITSIAGYMGLPFRGVYSATKGALSLITEAMRMEVKSMGIKITDIAPGDFATNIAAGRYHTPVFDTSAYKKEYAENLALMDAHVDSGLAPEIMARKVFDIIAAENPKVHYKVATFMQKFSIVLKRILPDKIYERLLMNHYKL